MGKKPASPQASANGKAPGSLWVLDEKQKLRKIKVQTGASDGINTAVEGAELREDMQVITGILLPNTDKGKNGGSNPFTPQFRSRKKSNEAK